MLHAICCVDFINNQITVSGKISTLEDFHELRPTVKSVGKLHMKAFLKKSDLISVTAVHELIDLFVDNFIDNFVYTLKGEKFF